MANNLNALLKGKAIPIALKVDKTTSDKNIRDYLNQKKGDDGLNLKVGVELDATKADLLKQIKEVQNKLTGDNGAIKLKVELDKLTGKDFNNSVQEIQRYLNGLKTKKDLKLEVDIDFTSAGKKLKSNLDDMYRAVSKFNDEVQKLNRLGVTDNIGDKFGSKQANTVKRITSEMEKLNKLSRESYEVGQNTKRLNLAQEYLNNARAISQNAENTLDLKRATDLTNDAMREMSEVRKTNANYNDQMKTDKLAEQARKYASEIRRVSNITEEEYNQLLAQIEQTSTKGSGEMKRMTDAIKLQLDAQKRHVKDLKDEYIDLTKLANDKNLTGNIFESINTKNVGGLKRQMESLLGGGISDFKMTQAFDKTGESIQKLTGKLKLADGAMESFTIEAKESNGTLKQTKSTIDGVGDEAQTLGTNLKEAFGQMIGWTIAHEALQGLKVAMREVVTQIFEVDKAMTEVRKVASDGINTEQLLEGTIQQSINLGSNLNEMLDSLGEVARTYGEMNEEQLMTVNQTATIMANVSDLDVPRSMDSLVGTMNAFKIEAEDAIRIVDRLNEVDKTCLVA